jgi:hypothetical protein
MFWRIDAQRLSKRCLHKSLASSAVCYQEKKRRLLAAEVDPSFEANKQAEDDLRRRQDPK